MSEKGLPASAEIGGKFIFIYSYLVFLHTIESPIAKRAAGIGVSEDLVKQKVISNKIHQTSKYGKFLIRICN